MTLATTPANAIESLFAILLLAFVHLFVKELGRLKAATRNALLSASAGASLVYVLLVMLPKLADKQVDLLASAQTGMRGFLEHHAYLVAMVGLLCYYGISRIASYGLESADSRARKRYRAAQIGAVVGYASYSFLIGYLIVNRLQVGLFSLGLITFGMMTLFLSTDYGLRAKWPAVYDSRVRWGLSLGVIGGWLLGILVEVSSNIVALWFAFLAGLMLITTIREKLSLEEEGTLRPFLVGVAGFTALILVLEAMPQGKL